MISGRRAKTPQELIARHEAFLECRPVDALVGLWIGGYYPAEQFPRGTAQWRAEQRLDPQDVRFSPFAADYESLYQAHRAADDDFFYVGSAYWGIPWLEAILGCPVAVVAANCRAEALLSDPRDFAGFDADLDANPWLDALLRFTRNWSALPTAVFQSARRCCAVRATLPVRCWAGWALSPL